MRPLHPRIARALLVLFLALPVAARADDIDDLAGSWVGRALRAQRLLDRRTPLHDIDVVGAHNAFNSSAYASGLRYLDPNQSVSIFNLLRMGARAIELDVHWTAKSEGLLSYPDRLLLCHGTAGHVGCSLDDRYLSEGIDEISAWLGTADSIDQVLLLHIEDHMDGHHGEAFAEIQSRIGNHVYGSGGCGDIPAGLTKADVLAAGKRIVLWNEGGCSGDAGWNSMVFTGLGAIRRTWEDSTTLGGGSRPSIGPGEVANAFAGDVNIVDLDQLTAGDARWAAAVWSWDVGEPNDVGNEDCAAQMGNGRWNDAPCTQQRAFACENVVTGSWAVPAATGPWGLGATACDALGEDFRFSVPTNSLDNALLRGAKATAGHDVVWLNHDDRANEGEWVSPDSDDVLLDPGSFHLAANEAVYGKTRMLRMEPNCNLVLYSLAGDVVGGGLWASGTANAGGNCRVDFQGDGDLVIRDGTGRVLWQSGTRGTELRLQSDGNLVLYDGNRIPLWSTFTNHPADLVANAGQFGLAAGGAWQSANRRLVLRGDCGLELASFENGVMGGVAWRSGTAGAGTGCRLDFQADGNLVLYDGIGRPLWASGTSGTVGAQLRMQADGNLVVYNGANQPLWATLTNAPAQAVIPAGNFSLREGGFVQTRNRKLELRDTCELLVHSVENFLVGGLLWRSGTAGAGTGCHADLQPDGNFVLYDGGGRALWAAGTSGTVGAQLRLQADGNLVVYNGANEPLWATYTDVPASSSFNAGQWALTPGQFVRHENRLLLLQEDCGLVLYMTRNALPVLRLWDTNTFGAAAVCRLDFQPDGNLVLYDGNLRPLWAAGTSGTSGAQVRLQADGNLVLYNGAGAALWTSQTPGNFSSVALCGDATCNGSENCSSCAGDCGGCPPPPCACGDGRLDATCGEQCDDGNLAVGDGCDAACQVEACACGDGRLDATCGEQCDDGNVVAGDGCDAACLLEICSPAPRSGCHEAAQAKLQYDEKRPGREQFLAQWKKIATATTQAGFGDPVGGDTAVAICLYDDAGALVQSFEVDRPGASCGGRPCWSALGGKGYAYGDKAGGAAGIQKMGYVAGDAGRGKADAQGRNDAAKGQSALPVGVVAALSGQRAVTMQLSTSAGACISATLSDVTRDDGLQYLAARR